MESYIASKNFVKTKWNLDYFSFECSPQDFRIRPSKFTNSRVAMIGFVSNVWHSRLYRFAPVMPVSYRSIIPGCTFYQYTGITRVAHSEAFVYFRLLTVWPMGMWHRACQVESPITPTLSEQDTKPLGHVGVYPLSLPDKTFTESNLCYCHWLWKYKQGRIQHHHNLAVNSERRHFL